MDMKEVMEQKNFVVVGDTVNKRKYANMIKEGLLEKDYKVWCVGKELDSINDVDGDIDILDLCINPPKGLELLKENKKPCKFVVIQPGAESEEIFAYLEEKNIPYMEGCLLVGLSVYAK